MGDVGGAPRGRVNYVAISKQFVEYVLEQLQGLERLTSRRMFSGVGLYSGGLFFGLLYNERLYFKTDDTTRPEYESRGSEGFCPRPNLERVKMTYYSVPADILEDAEELVKWARQATAVALASENAKPSKKSAGEGGQRRKGHGKRRHGKDGHSRAGPHGVVGRSDQRKDDSRKIAGKSGQRRAASHKVRAKNG
jgi:DNA transformation protein